MLNGRDIIGAIVGTDESIEIHLGEENFIDPLVHRILCHRWGNHQVVATRRSFEVVNTTEIRNARCLSQFGAVTFHFNQNVRTSNLALVFDKQGNVSIAQIFSEGYPVVSHLVYQELINVGDVAVIVDSGHVYYREQFYAPGMPRCVIIDLQ